MGQNIQTNIIYQYFRAYILQFINSDAYKGKNKKQTHLTIKKDDSSIYTINKEPNNKKDAVSIIYI